MNYTKCQQGIQSLISLYLYSSSINSYIRYAANSLFSTYSLVNQSKSCYCCMLIFDNTSKSSSFILARMN